MPPRSVDSRQSRASQLTSRNVIAERAKLAAKIAAKSSSVQKLRELKEQEEAELANLTRADNLLAQQEVGIREGSVTSLRSEASNRTREWLDNLPRPPVAKVTFRSRDDYSNIASRALQEGTVDPSRGIHQDFTQGARRARQSTPFDDRRNATAHTCVTDGGMVLEAPAEITRAHLIARKATPKELPKFSGEPSEWPMFVSTFYETTARCGYSQQENMIRLRDALTGQAYDLTKADLLVPRKVPEVMETLETIFGRQDLILHENVERIKGFPDMRGESLEQLIRFHLVVKSVVSTLESMGMEKALQDSYLLSIAIQKLAPSLKRDWAKCCNRNGDKTLAGFNEWLRYEAKLASEVTSERIQLSTPAPRQKESVPPPRRQPKEQLYLNQDDNMSSNSEPQVRATKLRCCYCHENHKLGECPSFLGADRGERWRVVNSRNLCCNCLGPHLIRFCRKRSGCGKNGCHVRHHALLHPPTQSPTSKQTEETVHHHDAVTPDSPPTEIPSADAVLTIHNNGMSTLFRIIPVLLYGDNTILKAYAFIDEGSSVTMIDDDLANQLGLTGDEEELCLRWTGDTMRTEKKSRNVTLGISSNGSQKPIMITQVRTVTELGLPNQSLDVKKLADKFQHLGSVPVESYSGVVPKILVGLPHWGLCVPLETIEGSLGDPIATRCRLGWSISGKFSHNPTGSFPHLHVCECHDRRVHNQVREFFSIDNFGTGPVGQVESLENARALKLLEEGTKFLGDRYETRLLWRRDEIVLPDSRPMANRRLQCLLSKMEKNPQLKENLHKQMADYREKGYVRKLSKDEALIMTPRTCYLPVFAVINPNKPDKVRMVWDAAATVCGTSLNDQLLKGPDLLTPLPEVLSRFRQYVVAVSGDIREMFHQVKIASVDQKSQRFLWMNEISNTVDTYEMTVMTFGASCSPSAAQFVKNLNASRFATKLPRAAHAISKCHYVDDYLDSFRTETEALSVARDVKRIHQRAGFEIRGWVTNSELVRRGLGLGTNEGKNLDMGQQVMGARVLGLWWDTSSDMLMFAFNPDRMDESLLDGTRRPTKREVLRVMMMVFDPLGLIANVLVQVKILLQELWRTAIGWDQPILDEHVEKWTRWIDAIHSLKEVRLPRCYSPLLSSSREVTRDLHIFVDASESAFAAVAYMRIQTPEEIAVVLIGSKTKVAPQKPVSIPRLELQAALLGVRLATAITKAHDVRFHSRTFWSDSSTVLSWLKTDPHKHHQFVSLRIGEILESTEIREWRFVPTTDNVADEATKWAGLVVNQEDRWFQGPPFLKLSKDKWPTPRFSVNATETALTTIDINFNVESATPDPTRFSRWTRIIRVQALVLRIIFRRTQNKRLSDPITPEDLQRAEDELVRRAQKEAFPTEIADLLANGKVERTSSLYKLVPFLDDRTILRARGRVDKRSQYISPDAIDPIIMQKTNRITHLLLTDYHLRYHHRNHETVVNEVRQRFWVPHLRTVLKDLRSKCVKCRNDAAKPAPPIMGTMPLSRTAAFAPPFSHTGLDYFGPIEVAVGRRVEKRWVALFTCLTIRAIHLEVVHNLTADSAIMAIRNMMSRRGQINTLWSDNGTNFRGAARELQHALADMDTTHMMAALPQITWRFIPPLSPHMGGCWERLVRSVKTAMADVLFCKRPRDDRLVNLLLEVESVINSRPLTYVPVELGDPEALTPNHFLLGSSNGHKAPGSFEPPPVAYKHYWKTNQQTTDMFWKRWLKEYVPTLTRRTKWHQTVTPVKIGDIGIIWEDGIRSSWTKGRVVDVHTGRDQQVRSVVVRTASGVYTRPIAKFAKLDILPSEQKCENEAFTPSHGGEDVNGRTASR